MNRFFFLKQKAKIAPKMWTYSGFFACLLLEDTLSVVILGFGKHFFTIFWQFLDQTSTRLMRITDRLLDKGNNLELQP